MATATEESGAGVLYGYRISAFLMGKLACESESYNKLYRSKITKLTLQGSFTGAPYDDQILHVDNGYGVHERHLLQCKLRVHAIPSNPVFQEVLGKAYTGMRDGYPNQEGSDLFVLVTQDFDKARELHSLITFAIGSTSLLELRQKLSSENRALGLLLETMLKTLAYYLEPKQKGEPAPEWTGDEEIFFITLTKLRIWHNDLHDVGSYDRALLCSELTQYVADRREADALLRDYEGVAGRAENDRATFTWQRLSDRFGRIQRPTGVVARGIETYDEVGSRLSVFVPKGSPTAPGPVRERYFDELEAEILSLMERSRAFAAFEAYGLMVNVLERELPLFNESMRKNESGVNRYAEVLCIAIRGIVNALFKMEARAEVYWEVISKTENLRVYSNRASGLIARFALEHDLGELFDKEIARVEDPMELALLEGLAVEILGDFEAASQVFQEVTGEYRADALLALARVTVLSDDSNEDNWIRAEGLARQAMELHPERTVLQLIYADYLTATIVPALSSCYRKNSRHRPGDIAFRITTANSIILKIFDEQRSGILETMMAARIKLKYAVVTPEEPITMPLSVTQAKELVSLQGSEEQVSYGALLHNFGFSSEALEWLDRLNDQPMDGSTAEELNRVRRAIQGESTRVLVIPEADLSKQASIAMLRDAYYAAIQTNHEALAIELFEEVESSPLDVSFKNEIRLLATLMSGEWARAHDLLKSLIRDFPVAIASWSALLTSVKGLCRTSSSATLPHGDQLRNFGLLIAPHACALSPTNGNFGSWIELAATVGDSRTDILDQISRAAGKSENEWASAVAAGLASEDRKDYENAARNFDVAISHGGLSASLRTLHDQVRWLGGLGEDLIATREEMLQDKHRHPGRAAFTVYSLRESGQNELALDVARRNRDDFTESRDAAWIYLHTCLETGRSDLGLPALQEFTRRFPDDKRAWTEAVPSESGELPDVITSLFERDEPWEEPYARCEFPLHLVPQRLPFKFLAQSRTYVGIQGYRGYFGVPECTVDDLTRPVLLDYTGLLTIEQYGLWDIVWESGLKLTVPAQVVEAIRFDYKLSNLERKQDVETKLDKLTQAFAHPQVLVRRTLLAEEMPAGDGPFSYVALDEALRVHQSASWISSSQTRPDSWSLLDVLRRAAKDKLLSGADFARFSAMVRGPETDRADTLDLDRPFPKRVLVDDRDFLLLIEFGLVDVFVKFFDSFTLPPSTLLAIDLQYGRLFGEREARLLVGRLMTTIEDIHIIEKTPLNRMPGDQEVQYLIELGRIALDYGALVWIDDIATRRLFASEFPGVVGASSIEIVGRLADSGRAPKSTCELALLELAANGQRDLLSPFALTWGEGSSPTAAEHGGMYLDRLAWQSEQGAVIEHEKLRYLTVLAQNLANLAFKGVDKLDIPLRRVIKARPKIGVELVVTLITILRNTGGDLSYDVARAVAAIGQELTDFDLGRYVHTISQRAMLYGAGVPDMTLLPLDTQFKFWFKRGNPRFQR